MAHKVNIAPLPPFDPAADPTSLSQRWKTWKRRFETYLAAVNVTDDKRKRALLLYHAGQETQKLFDTFTDTGDTYATALKRRDNYFAPKKNVDFKTFQFRQAVQQDGETINQYVARLCKLAVTCEFSDADKELKAAVMQHCQSKQLHCYALREDNLTLEKLLAKVRALEASERQACGMEQSSATPQDTVHRLREGKPKGSHTQQTATVFPKKPGNSQCRKCGLTWPHKDNPCPALGQMCRKCGKMNHFARVCRSTTADKFKRIQPQQMSSSIPKT